MNREFLLNILFLVFINLLIKPFFIFGIDLGVQNRAPEGDYGLYFALLNFTYIFQIFNDFGIQNFNNRSISQHPQLLPKYFPNLLFLKILLSLLYVALSLGAALAVGYGGREIGLLGILLLNQILAQGIFFLRSNVSGVGFFRTDSLLSSLDKLLMIVFCGLILWLPALQPWFSVELFAWAQTAALALTAAAAFFILKWKIRRAGLPAVPFRLKIRRPFLIFLFKKSWPFALVILLMTAYARLDAVLLERLLPDGHLHADVFASGFRLLDACNMLGYLFATLLLPMFARLLKRGSGEAVRPLLSLSFRMLCAGSWVLAAAVFFARQEIVELMMPLRATAYRWNTLGILIWVFVPVSVTYIFSTLLTANENLMQMNRFFVLALLLDVGLNLWLVPRFQAIGSALAALGTQVFVAVSMVALCVRTFRLRAGRGSVLRLLAFGTAVLTFDFFIFEKTELPWEGQFVLALAGGVAAVFGFKVLTFRMLRAAEGF